MTVVSLVAGASLVCGCGAASTPAAHGPRPPGSSVGTRLDGAVQSTIKSLRLRDSTGRAHTLASLRGKVLVVSDTMTLCQETCPIDTASLLQTARAVDRAGLGSKVEFLTVTVDPQRDTSAQLAAYRKLYAPAPANWLTLTGSSADIDTLWRTLGVYRKKVPEDDPAHPPRNWRTGAPLTYDVQHSDEVFFFDARQHERFILDGVPDAGGKSSVSAKLYAFMSADGHQNLSHPGATDWTVPQALQVVGWLEGRRIPA